MDEFEDKLNALMNDPGELARFASFAKSIMGGDEVGQSLPEADPGLMKKISSIMSADGGKSANERKLLEAMRPYLSQKRRDKMDKALKIARLASLAALAEESGGDGDV